MAIVNFLDTETSHKRFRVRNILRLIFAVFDGGASCFTFANIFDSNASWRNTWCHKTAREGRPGGTTLWANVSY